MRLLLALCVAILVAGCGSAQGKVIDGWSVGAPYPCSPCQTLIDHATSGWQRIHPNSPAIVRTTLYAEALPTDAFGRPIMVTTTLGPPVIAVLDLVDGSTHAVGLTGLYHDAVMEKPAGS